MKDESFRPNRVLSYFQEEWKILFFVTVSGLIYNLGLLAGPWFEGKMTGKLVDLLGGTGTFHQMLMLVTAYVVSIGIVQVSRYFKRFYVRRFAGPSLHDFPTHFLRDCRKDEGHGTENGRCL